MSHMTYPSPQLVHLLSTVSIAIPLLTLFILTAYLLFVSSDENVAAIWAQCGPDDSTGLLPELSLIPLFGQPACFLVSFFDYAMASSRAFAIMSVILSFVGALLTVSTVESARLYNRSTALIRYPTIPWLLFNLAGGAVAWQLMIIPAFIHHSRKTSIEQLSASARTPLLAGVGTSRHNCQRPEERLLGSAAELYAIPTSILLGYIAPSIVMLFVPSPASIAVWLFFPLWVAIIRQATRSALILLPISPQFTKDETNTLSLESSKFSLAIVYSLPVLLSIISQMIVLNNLQYAADGSPTTRAALGFIEIDFSAIALTVYYWLLLEAGWKTLGLAIGCSVVAGPGAGFVIGWILREETFQSIQHNQRRDE